MKRIVVLLALLLLPAIATAKEPAGSKKLKQADKKLQGQINLAIRKGTTWLLKQQEKDGSFPHRRGGEAEQWPTGGTAMALLTLLHCGVKPDDRSIRKGFANLRKVYEERKGQPTKYKSGLKVYETAVTVMALAQLGTEKASTRKKRRKKRSPLGKADRAWMQEMTNWLVENQMSNGGWGYPYAGVDESNSQYAMLALAEARRMKLKVPSAVFEKAFDYWQTKQEKDGPKVRRHIEKGGDGVFNAHRTVARVSDRARGWGYRGSAVRGSMTTAGVAVMAILRARLRDRKRRRDAERSMYDGMAWLGHHFSVTGNPKYTRFHLYYLYGLERAGVLGGVVWMGEHRWYAEGARYLVDAQKRDGSWVTGTDTSERGVVGSCFALLFLVRSTSHSYGLRPVITPRPSGEPEEDAGQTELSATDRAELTAALAALAPAIAEAERAEEDGDATRMRAAMAALVSIRERLRTLKGRTKSTSHLVTIHAALEDIESWLADYRAAKPAAKGSTPKPPSAQGAPKLATPPVPEDKPAAEPPLADLDTTGTLTAWCHRAAARYDDLASPEARADLARKAAEHAGIIALPTLARWFDQEQSAMARVGIHEALAAVGGWRVARLMRRHARRDAATRRMDALEVIYRCLMKPDDVEPERPFVRAIRAFHRLRDRKLSLGIQRRLDAMGTPGVAALGQLLYVPDFGYHNDTIDRLAKKTDRRAVPPLVYKMNRFKFDYREQLPAHLALVRMGWHAVPALIDLLDDKAAGTWISWTLRKITRETTGTQKRKWHEWWKKEKHRHPELEAVPEDTPATRK